MYSNQEIFDIIAKHLLSQKVKSIISSGNCKYYIPERNLRCAVGILFKDFSEAEIEEVGNTTIGALYDPLTLRAKKLRNLLNKAGVDVNDSKQVALLQNLQILHDFKGTQEWIPELKRVAKEYNLEYRF